MANVRRRKFLAKLRVNGVLLIEEVAIKEGMANAFQSTLSDSGDLRPPISGLDFAFVSSLETQALEVPFTTDEVFAALSCLNGDKTPRPDGFSMAFWQACWDVVKKKVMGFFFTEFHEFGTFQGA